jgi:transposase InsO family protein
MGFVSSATTSAATSQDILVFYACKCNSREIAFACHAVIDDFSGRILSWRLVLRLEPQTTCQVLAEAAKNLPKDGAGATVVADSGGDYVNQEVDSLLGLG